MSLKKLVRINTNLTEGSPEFIQTLFVEGFKGVCVDVGAYDPFWINNSWIFEEAGWDTYCIEPNITCIPRLKQYRKNVLHCACGDENKDNVDLFVFQVNAVGEAAGTGLVDHRKDPSSGVFHSTIYSHTNKVNVRTLDWLMEHEIKQDRIDYLSIDVERSEMAILRGTSLEKWKPKVIIIENLEKEKDQYEYLESKNYKYVHRMVYNDIYMLDSYYDAVIKEDPV